MKKCNSIGMEIKKTAKIMKKFNHFKLGKTV